MGILIFLLAAAIYDWKYRFIPGWLYVAAAIEAVLWIGKGDGLTFMITGIYLGLWRNLCLLWFSLILCSLWGAGLMVLGRMGWKQVKKKELPFLPFVFPVGVWLTIL